MNRELIFEDVNESEQDAIFQVLEYRDELEIHGEEAEVIALINISLDELPDQKKATKVERFNAVANLMAFIRKTGSHNRSVTDLMTQPLEEVSGGRELADYILRYEWMQDLKVEKIRLERVEWSSGRDKKHEQINKVITQVNQQLREMGNWSGQEDSSDMEYGACTQVSEQKRTNELHELIKDVCLSMREKKGFFPTAKGVWKEIEDNCGDYDGGSVVEEVADSTIFWRPIGRSQYSDALSLKSVSFSSLLSRIKKDITAKNCG